MESSVMHIRVNKEVKDGATPILKEMHLSVSDVLNMVLNQIRLEGKLPFTPALTKEKLEEIRRFNESLDESENSLKEQGAITKEKAFDLLNELELK